MLMQPSGVGAALGHRLAVTAATNQRQSKWNELETAGERTGTKMRQLDSPVAELLDNFVRITAVDS